MKYEWDADKSKVNLKKHGIGFEEAIKIWDSLHVRIDNIAKTTEGEKRYASIGELEMKKKEPTTLRFKNTKEMDNALQNIDISSIMLAKGKVVKPNIKKRQLQK